MAKSENPDARRLQLIAKAQRLGCPPDGKMVITAMIANGVTKATIPELNELCNAPTFEVTEGLLQLATLGVNLDKTNVGVTLSAEWT